jgi:membrane-bound inhibitor of C-type lysozyme
MESIKEFPRGITDQAISGAEATAEVERSPWSGLQATSYKLQATSYKRQASSVRYSCKQQALNVVPIVKRQAWRFAMIGQETVDRGALIKFY